VFVVLVALEFRVQKPKGIYWLTQKRLSASLTMRFWQFGLNSSGRDTFPRV